MFFSSHFFHLEKVYEFFGRDVYVPKERTGAGLTSMGAAEMWCMGPEFMAIVVLDMFQC